MKIILFILFSASIICYAEESDSKHARLAEILKLPKKLHLQSKYSNECKLAEGVVRVWAHSVTDNKSYMLWLPSDPDAQVRLIEFDGNNQRLMKTNKIKFPEWLPGLYDNPIDLRSNNVRVGATIQHGFIVEGIKNSKYQWAYREIEIADKSDYSNLLNLLASVTIDPIDIGWTVEMNPNAK